MNDPSPSFWQWTAQTAMAVVLFLGGLIMRDFKQRLVKVEDSHRGLVTKTDLSEQLESQAEERRWMHEQNTKRFDALSERLDRILDRE